MMEWQPIETAPKDGSDILVAVMGRVIITAFDTDYRTWPDDHWEKFTHWMPLPDAPRMNIPLTELDADPFSSWTP